MVSLLILLIMKSGRDPRDVYHHIKDIGIQDISMEVMGDFDQMYAEGYKLQKNLVMLLQSNFLAPVKVFIKAPFWRRYQDQRHTGLQCRSGSLSIQGRGNLCLALCRTPGRPVSGRLEVVRSISELYRIHRRRHKFVCIQQCSTYVRSWYNGVEICTLPPKVFEENGYILPIKELRSSKMIGQYWTSLIPYEQVQEWSFNSKILDPEQVEEFLDRARDGVKVSILAIVSLSLRE